MGGAISGEDPSAELQNKAKNLDARLLEYKESADVKPQSTSNVMWDNMVHSKTADTLLEESLDPNNNRVNNDACVQRLTFIVNEYEKLQKNKSSPYQFVSSLKHYSLVQLLNDWIHVKSVYVDNKYASAQFNPSALFDYFQIALKETEESQHIYTRNLKDRSILGESGTRKIVYNGFSDSYNVVTIQLLDALHCFCYHGEAVGGNDDVSIAQKREWELTCGVDAQLQTVSDVLQGASDEDDSKNNSSDKLLRQKQTLLLGGESFYYWDFFEGDAKFCRCRYASLKQEILQNQVFKLTQAQFDDLLLLSKLWKRSIVGQFCTAFNRKDDRNEAYGVEPGLPLSMAHIMAVLMFSNYDLLSFKYITTGCNRMGADEFYAAVQSRNQEIGHWYKLMREVVLFYGEQSSREQSFYLPLDSHLLFSSFTPKFEAPTLYSSALAVARTVVADGGAIIEYGQHSTIANPFLDVSFCASFPHRQSKLFACSSVMEVRDIFVQNQFGKITSNRNYVHSILLFQRMINGQYFEYLLDQQSNTYRRLLMQLMDNELSNDKNKKGPTYLQQHSQHSIQYAGLMENGVLKYVQALFAFMLGTSKEMWIIQSQYSKVGDALQNYLVTLHDSAFKQFAVCWHKRLRQSMQTQLAFKFVNEWKWELDADELQQYKQNLKTDADCIEGPELELQQAPNSFSTFVFVPLLFRNRFGIKLKKLPQQLKNAVLEWDVFCPAAASFILSAPSAVLYADDTDVHFTFDVNQVAHNASIEFSICVKVKQ